MSTSRSSYPEVLCKKVLLNFSQNSQENNRAGVSYLIKLEATNCMKLSKKMRTKSKPQIEGN